MGENPAVNLKLICRSFAWLVVGGALNLSAQGTTFFYQGRLNDNGSPATGAYDLRFALTDAAGGGNAIGVTQTNFAVPVSSGMFATNINVGAVFTGTNYWLSIGVRTNGSTNAFTQLLPLQPVLPTPYAIFANTASNLLGALSATQLVGTLPSAQVSGSYLGSVNFTNATNNFFGKYFGNGVGLTNLNATMLSTGTVADARLSTNVALLNTNQIFSGINQFTSVSNTFTGNFFGNGLVGWIPVSVTATQAIRDAGYLLLNSNLTTITLPPTNTLFVGDIVRISGPGAGGWRVAQGQGEAMTGYFLSPTNAAWLQANAASAGWRAVAASADGIKMVASAIGGGGIYVSADSGQTWSQANGTFSPTCLASSADGTKLFGGIFGGGIVCSTNSGGSWFLGSGAPTTNWNGIACSADGSKVVAVINLGRIYTSYNTGITWSQQSNPPLQTWFSVACSANGSNMAAVIYGGKIYTSVNAGVTWVQQGNSATANWTGICSSYDGSKLAACSFNGNIYTSLDSGANWTQQTNAPTTRWYSIDCSSDGGRIVACVNTNGGIYVSANFGLNWTKQAVADQNWYSVSCSDDCTRVIAGYADTVSTGALYYWQPSAQITTTTMGINGSVTGNRGSAVELQYIGDGIFMPIGGTGTFWAN